MAKADVQADVPTEKSWWDYHDEIEALKEARATVWRGLIPDDPHTVEIPKDLQQRLYTAVEREHEHHVETARQTGQPIIQAHFGLDVHPDTVLTDDRREWLVHMAHANYLARQAEGHPDILALDAKIRRLRTDQLAFCQEPDYTIEPARPGSREGDGWE